MNVRFAIALPGRQLVLDLALPEGSSVADAIAAARTDPRAAGIDFAGMQTGIWSRACDPGTALREGDRVELYRALQADPKQRRRARARAGGARR